jgi:hypothetical protein
MSKAGYLPRGDKERVVWLSNFSVKFATTAASLGFTAADVTLVNNDNAMFAYLVTQVEVFTTAKEQRVIYKNLIREGPLGSPGGVPPVAPPAGGMPAIVAPGIFPRLAQLVQRIKNSPTYTEAIGKDLGIIGTHQTLDTSLLKPTLKLVIKGGQVEVQWTKGEADSIRIETDKGAGWQFLAIDAIPHFTDSTPITAPATWKYRAMYIVSDELVGQWSDVASIGVS